MELLSKIYPVSEVWKASLVNSKHGLIVNQCPISCLGALPLSDIKSVFSNLLWELNSNRERFVHSEAAFKCKVCVEDQITAMPQRWGKWCGKKKITLYLLSPNTFRILSLSILLLFTFSVSGQLRVQCIVCCFIFAGITRARPFTWSLKRTLRSAVSSVLWAPTR